MTSATSWQGSLFSLLQNSMIMDKMDLYEKLNQPGLWFVDSEQLSKFVYEIGVVLGQPLTVFTSAKKEIQNEVFSLVKKDCLEGASDEQEYNWLEQELSEYNTHGFLWHPEELNDYLPNGSFWTNYVQFDEDDWLWLDICRYNTILLDDIAKMWWEDETEISRILQLVEKDAIEKGKIVFVFVSPCDGLRIDKCFNIIKSI